MISTDGKDFKFSRNILKHEWSVTRSRIKPEIIERIKDNNLPLPRLNLRLSRLEHINRLKRYLKRLRYNPIHSIEYGELLSTKDLSTSSYSEIIDKVKKFCTMSGVKFHLSTPKILIERDFDRVYEYSKSLILLEPRPDLLIINNIGYFWAVINDPDLADIPIEIGQGINLLNSMSINCLNQLHNIDYFTIEIGKTVTISGTLQNLTANQPIDGTKIVTVSIDGVEYPTDVTAGSYRLENITVKAGTINVVASYAGVDGVITGDSAETSFTVTKIPTNITIDRKSVV